MATKFINPTGGSDAETVAETFATAWKTITSGATAGRIASGDTIKIMESPGPTLVGNASWTNANKTVTLASAVTLNVDLCSAAWTAANSATTSTDTTNYKEGSQSCSFTLPASLAANTKYAYITMASTDFSGYQQLSFWFRRAAGTAYADGNMRLCLCSDTTGDTIVDSFDIPSSGALNRWMPVVVNKGSALGSAIQSVALYTGASTPSVSSQFRIDNIIACKATSSADSLNLTSLIAKKHILARRPSTTYAVNDIVTPPTPRKNGMQYKVTAQTSATSASADPGEWTTVIGATFTDGGVTFQCDDIQEMWYPIKSIDGTTVILDADTNAVTATGRGYAGATEASVATYKRETFKLTPQSAAGNNINSPTEDGSSASVYTYTGGWDSTNMSTQDPDGETWFDGQNGFGNMFRLVDRTYNDLNNLHGVRSSLLLLNSNSTSGNQSNMNNIRHMHGIGMSGDGSSQIANIANQYSGTSIIGLFVGSSNPQSGIGAVSLSPISNGKMAVNGIAAISNYSGTGIRNVPGFDSNVSNVAAINNSGYGVTTTADISSVIKYMKTSGNSTAGVYSAGNMSIENWSCGEGTAVGFLARTGARVRSCRHNRGAAHFTYVDGGVIASHDGSGSDQRRTASGLCVKVSPTSTTSVTSAMPIVVPLAEFAVNASALVTVKAWFKRDNAGLTMSLVCPGGQIAGVPSDVSASVTDTGTYQELTITFTPTEAGVVSVEARVYGGTTYNGYIDDMTITQA